MSSWKSLSEIYTEIYTENVAEGKEFLSAQDLISKIKELDSNKSLTPEVIEYLNQYLSTVPYKIKIINHLNRHNLNSSTFSGGPDNNVEDIIINTIARNNDLENYINYISSPVDLSSIGKSGNLVEIMSNKTEMSIDTVKSLINITGTESGRGIGKGEVFSAAVFNDVSQGGAGEGDLNWNGRYLEVKGTSARLGGRDRTFDNFENITLGKIAYTLNTPGTANSIKIVDIIVNIAKNKSGNIEKEQLQNAIREFITMAYGVNIDNIIKLESIDLKDPKKVRNMLTTIYFTSYAMRHDVSDFLFIRTDESSRRGFGNFRLFSASEIKKLVDENIISCGVITLNDLDPSLNTIK